MNEKKKNKIITTLCDKIAKYFKNLLKKENNEYTNKILEVEIKIKHDLMRTTNFTIISSFKEYVILRNEWKESIFEASILESKSERNIESQTIQLLAYKNLLHIELKMSSTTRHVDIQNIDKKFKKAKKIWETHVWKKYESLLKTLTSKQNKNQDKVKQLWREYLQENQQDNYNYVKRTSLNDQNISNLMQSAQFKSSNEYWSSSSSWNEMIIEKKKQKLTTKINNKNSKEFKSNSQHRILINKMISRTTKKRAIEEIFN